MKLFIAHIQAQDTKLLIAKVSYKLWNRSLLLFIYSLSLPKLVKGFELFLVVLAKMSETLPADLKIVMT